MKSKPSWESPSPPPTNNSSGAEQCGSGASAQKDMSCEHHDNPQACFGFFFAAASGCIIGFLFAEHLSLSATAFAALTVGLLLGWVARGLAG